MLSETDFFNRILNEVTRHGYFAFLPQSNSARDGLALYTRIPL
jgi:hypothetical protein